MIIGLDKVESPAYCLGAGDYTLKIISVADGVYKKIPYIDILFVSPSRATHKERFWVQRHASRIKQLGEACNLLDGDDQLDTKDLTGCYVKARIDVLKFGTGEYSDRFYIQNIRPSNRRKDNSGSSLFSRREIAEEKRKNMRSKNG